MLHHRMGKKSIGFLRRRQLGGAVYILEFDDRVGRARPRQS